MTLGPSVFIGAIAGELAGAACKALEIEGTTKNILQASACASVGITCAIITADPFGGVIIAGEATMYALGTSPAIVLTLLGGISRNTSSLRTELSNQ